MLEVLGAASQSPEIAHRFANGFNNHGLQEWIYCPDKAAAYLAWPVPQMLLTAVSLLCPVRALFIHEV
jgi:hypothetical protein